MSGSTFEQLRVPAALLLIVVAAFVFWPREDGQASSVQATPTPTVVAGQPGGQVVAPTAEPPPPTPIPTLSSPPSAAPTPVATADPTPVPEPEPEPPAAAQDGFTAELLVCQSISGAACNGQLANVPPNVGSVTALVRFAGANGGDVINAILRGPSGTFDGGIYSLQGGGDGYYYATFGMQGLEAGDYIVTATRNGDVVATTGFFKDGG